jgi:hypothetical protein
MAHGMGPHKKRALFQISRGGYKNDSSYLEKMGDGRWEMGDGRWEMGDGRWEMGDGRWEMGDGRWMCCL